MSTATEQLTELSADEVVTHSYVRDVPLPSGGLLALITLDNGRDHTRPSTLGPATLHEFGATLDAVRSRASSGEIAAIAVTGKPYFLAAGADLSKVSAIPSREVARELARAMRVHSARFGVFPYERLVAAVVPDLRGGVEFPGAMLLGDGQAIGDPTGSHEVAHEWWYGLVGANQARSPWLDEAFATYA